MGGQGHGCCHSASWNEEITLELLAALSSEFLAWYILLGFFFRFFSGGLYEMSQHSRAQREFRNSSWWRNKQSSEKWKEVAGSQLNGVFRSRAARTEHVKQSEKEKSLQWESYLLAQGWCLSLSVCISPERCALIALKSMRTTQLRAVK